MSHRWDAVLVTVALGGLLCPTPVSPAAEENPQQTERLGMTIRIDLPITDRMAGRVRHFVDQAMQKARREEKRPVLIFEFRAPEDNDRGNHEKFAGQTEFSDALKLARLLTSKELASAQTVAYIPSSLPGHAVLVAMACEDILMPGDAQLGPVGIESGPVGKTEQIAYREIAGRRKTIPTEVALWMLDPSREVLVVQTEAGRECLSAEQLEELEKTGELTILSQEPLRQWAKGQPGQLTGDEAWRLDMVSYKPVKRSDVARLLELPPNAINEDPSLVQQWRAILVTLKGQIQPGAVNQAIRMIEDQVRLEEKNFVCVWIDSPGGSLTDSIRMADFLANELDPGKVRTVAYVAQQARADAALIALACDQVVMHAQAELGGASDYVLSGEDVEAIREEEGPWKSRPWPLVAAMLDPDLAVFECRPKGQVGGRATYLTEGETKQLDLKKWTIGKEITRGGEPLSVDGQRAIEYGLAELTAEGLDELMQHYGLEELTSLEPGWADRVVEVLKKPGVGAFLLMIAFLALYIELHAPGLGIGGFVSALFFLLFFWIKYMDNTAGSLEIMLFLAGVCCLVLEIYVLPGFGIFGLGGGCLVLASLVLASQTAVLPQSSGELRRSLVPVAMAMLGVVVGMVLLRRWLPHVPILNQMMLEPPTGEEAEEISRRESLVDLEGFVGARGIATTQLTPGGKARFGEMLVDVITDGEVIGRGTEIEVVQVQGNRVTVRGWEKE